MEGVKGLSEDSKGNGGIAKATWNRSAVRCERFSASCSHIIWFGEECSIFFISCHFALLLYEKNNNLLEIYSKLFFCMLKDDSAVSIWTLWRVVHWHWSSPCSRAFFFPGVPAMSQLCDRKIVKGFHSQDVLLNVLNTKILWHRMMVRFSHCNSWYFYSNPWGGKYQKMGWLIKFLRICSLAAPTLGYAADWMSNMALVGASRMYKLLNTSIWKDTGVLLTCSKVHYNIIHYKSVCRDAHCD